VAYAAPMAGFMAASLPISIWFGKFGTDTLLIPAAAIGSIVMIARIWDGISDPLAGTLSDRTKTRFGRALHDINDV
jgi:Na+/melibiose symporter-like transporter